MNFLFSSGKEEIEQKLHENGHPKKGVVTFVSIILERIGPIMGNLLIKCGLILGYSITRLLPQTPSSIGIFP